MQIEIDGRTIGRGSEALIIAEISANHGQCFDTAVELIHKAKDCGVDAVKFQAFKPGLSTIDADNEFFRLKHSQWGDQTLYELYEKAYTPWEWFDRLKKTADDLGLMFLCTAYEKTSVDFLEKMDICAHKVASFELVDIPFIEYVAKTGKPLMMSTGMADICEIHEAVTTAREHGAKDIILLKCVSSYPAKPEEMNLKTLGHMEELFGCPVGLSDHSLGIGASLCAVALGAVVIEKHITLSRENQTADSFFSIEPAELKELVENIRIVEKSIGSVHYGLTETEKESKIFRRSLFVIKDIKVGEELTEDNVRSIRPGYGLSPKYLKNILGKKVNKDIKKGTPLSWVLVSD